MYVFSVKEIIRRVKNACSSISSACRNITRRLILNFFYIFNNKKKLIYRGRFDKSTPGNNEVTDGGDLLKVINSINDGKILDSDQHPSMGCNIKWKKNNEPDYIKKI